MPPENEPRRATNSKTTSMVTDAWEDALLEAPQLSPPPTAKQIGLLKAYFKANKTSVYTNLRKTLLKTDTSIDPDDLRLHLTEGSWDLETYGKPKYRMIFETVPSGTTPTLTRRLTIRMQDPKIMGSRAEDTLESDIKNWEAANPPLILTASDRFEVGKILVRVALNEFASTLPSDYMSIRQDMQIMGKSIIEAEAENGSSQAVSAIASDISLAYKQIFGKEITRDTEIKVALDPARLTKMNPHGIVVPFIVTVITDEVSDQMTAQLSCLISQTTFEKPFSPLAASRYLLLSLQRQPISSRIKLMPSPGAWKGLPASPLAVPLQSMSLSAIRRCEKKHPLPNSTLRAVMFTKLMMDHGSRIYNGSIGPWERCSTTMPPTKRLMVELNKWFAQV